MSLPHLLLVLIPLLCPHVNSYNATFPSPNIRNAAFFLELPQSKISRRTRSDMEEVTKEGPGEPPQTNRVSVDPPPAMSKEEVTEEGSGELPRTNRDSVDPPPAILKEEVTEEGSGKPSRTKRDSVDLPPAPLFDSQELRTWPFYRAVIAEFMAALLYLYFTIATIIGYKALLNLPPYTDQCNGVGLLGVAWSFGGMIFVLVYCTAGISGGHINPAVTFGFFLVRRVSLPRAIAYIAAQCSGAICGAGLARAFMTHFYDSLGGGVNSVSPSYSKRTALGAEIIGTFVLMYTVFSASNPKRSARVSHIPVLAPLPIGFAVFMVHLAAIPIAGTGINPARSLGAAVIYNRHYAWDDQWIFWVGPFVGAFAAAICHQCLSRATAKEPLRIRWLDSFLNCILEDPSEFLLDNA